jgi:hypothetical protein
MKTRTPTGDDPIRLSKLSPLGAAATPGHPTGQTRRHTAEPFRLRAGFAE